MSELIVPEPEKKPPEIDPEAEAAYYDAHTPTRCTECWNIRAYCTCPVTFRGHLVESEKPLPSSLRREDFDRAAGGFLAEQLHRYAERGIDAIEQALRDH